MYKGMNTLGEQINEKIGYAGQSMMESQPGYDSGHDDFSDPSQTYAGMEDEHMKDAYGTESGSGYKGMDEKEQKEKEKSAFDELVDEEAEQSKQSQDKEDEETTQKTPTTMEEFAQQIDVEKARASLTEKKKSKEDHVRKELEDAIKSEQVERI